MLLLVTELVLEDLLTLRPFLLIFLLHVLDAFGVDKLQLLDTLLSLFLLLFVKCVPFALFFEFLLFDQLLLFFAALFCDFDEFFAVEFCVFQIQLVLLMLLSSRNQLLLILFLFVLFNDKLGSETLLSHSNLVDLLLIIFGQKDCLRGESHDRS